MAERPAACAEWQEDLAGWLMAELPPEREARLRVHVDSCPTCRAEAESLLAVTAVSLAAAFDDVSAGEGRDGTGADQGGADPVAALEPPDELGTRILASISSERRRRRLARAALVAVGSAAAALVLVVALQRDDAGQTPLRGQEVVFSVVPDGATAGAVVADDDGGGSVVQLTATGLDPDTTYALWLTRPGGSWDDRVAAGTFRPDDHGAVDVRLRCALPADAYARVWATTPGGEIALDTE